MQERKNIKIIKIIQFIVSSRAPKILGPGFV